MASFFEICRYMEQNQGTEEDLQALKVVRKGLTFAKPGCKDFWEAFKELCNDAKGLSALLNVDTTTISRWPGDIEMYLTKVRTTDNVGEKKAALIPTGNQPLTATAKDVRGTTEEPRPM